jgi:tetratricopeptide (TPR) repeat protein
MNERPFKLARHIRSIAPVALSPEWGKGLDDLLDEGRLSQALEYAKPYGSPLDWDGAEAMAAGSRLLYQAGAERASFLQVARAFRKYPQQPRVMRAWTWFLWRRQSPLRVWRYLQSVDPSKYSPKDAAAIWRRRSNSFLDFRDFKGAEEANQKAAELTSKDTNYLWQLARIRWAEDRLEEACVLAYEALTLSPRETDLNQLLSHLLQKLARDEEHESVLRNALTWSEDRFLVYPLIGLYTEQKRYPEISPWLERAAAHAPWAELPLVRWLHARYFDAYYFQGKHENLGDHAEQTGQDFYRETFKRLASPPTDARRVQINVPYVGQQFNTCGPATLVALARFWGRDLQQAEVVKAIWYNGTYDWQERQWCEKQGFVVREFHVTWDAARRLLQAGLPFAMGTAGPGWAHMQAVMGFDDWRNSLFVREPSNRVYNEYDQAAWLKQQSWLGPRGLVFVPPERGAELAGINLPDAEYYDSYYHILVALKNHRRTDAADLVEQLRKNAPGHYLTLNAERSLAEFDDNRPARLASVRRLRASFPESQELALFELACLQSEGTAQERIALLTSFSSRKDCQPLLRMELAEELQNDARAIGSAKSELWRAHAGFNNARILRAFANLGWELNKKDEALQYYRFAYTHDPLTENYADAYFKALHLMGCYEEGILLLRERFERNKAISGKPAQTLANAYELAERRTAAIATLDEAIAIRPNDTDLRVWSVEFAASHNLCVQAKAWLTGAGPQPDSVAWLRAAARLALAEGRPADALAFWRRVAEAGPTNVSAHEEISSLLSRIDGKPAALAHLHAMAERFPHHLGLQQLYIRWLRVEDRAKTVSEIERMLVVHPEDGWLRRELANQLAELGRPDEAMAHVREALAREPLNGASLNVAAFVARCRKDYAAAREYFQAAIRLSASNTYAVEKLLALGATRQESDADFTFVEQELARQDYPAEGVREFTDRTWDSDAPERAINLLQNALRVNPGAWHNHANYSSTLLRLGRIDEAQAAAKMCIERFPMLAGSWLLLAYACSAKQDVNGRIEAAEMAVKYNPEGDNCVDQLGSAYAAAGRFTDELELYQRTLARCPHIAIFHSRYAQALARAGKTTAAIKSIEKALELAASDTSSWNYLDRWGGREACLAHARALNKIRPGDVHAWLALARYLDKASPVEPVVEALNHACRCDPWRWEVYDNAAAILSDRGFYVEALARCTPAVFTTTPIFLRGRAASIIYLQGKRSEAIAAMKSIIEEDPTYHWATMELIEWLHDTADYAGALVYAERASARWPRSRLAWGWLASIAIANKQNDRAIAALKQALRVDPTYTWGWEKLQSLVPRSELETQAREMIHLCPGHPEPWMMLAYACDENRRLDECLQALDEAVARQARLEKAHEYRAMMLTRASRYNEALAACSPPAFGADPPLALKGRAAWIMWEMNRNDEAIAAMQKILADHPSYNWGSVRLMGWLEQTKKWAELLAVAQGHQKHFPEDGPGYGYAATAHHVLRQFDEEIQSLTNAVIKCPSYTYAVDELVRLHIKALRWQKGKEVLDVYGSRIKPGQKALFQAQLAIGSNDRPAFVDAIKNLAKCDDYSGEDFNEFKKYLSSIGWFGLFEKTLRKALYRGEVSNPIAASCVAMKLAQGQWLLWPLAWRLRHQPKIMQSVLVQYLFALANESSPSLRIRWVFWRYRKIIGSQTNAWANAASCLEHIDSYRTIIKWMADWRTRADAELWAFLNLLYAHLGLRRYQDAENLAQELLAKRARQKGSDQVHTVLAFTCAISGKNDLAITHRAAVQKITSDRVLALLNHLTDAIVAASNEEAGQPKAIRERLDKWREMVSNWRIYCHKSQANCCLDALICLNRKVPKSVRWRDWWAVAMIYRRAYARRMGWRTR